MKLRREQGPTAGGVFWRLANRSGFGRMFARGRARAGIERPNYLKLPPLFVIFLFVGGNFKEFGLLAIEAFVACP